MQLLGSQKIQSWSMSWEITRQADIWMFNRKPWSTKSCANNMYKCMARVKKSCSVPLWLRSRLTSRTSTSTYLSLMLTFSSKLDPVKRSTMMKKERSLRALTIAWTNWTSSLTKCPLLAEESLRLQKMQTFSA
jgi:hypothetical protein